MPPKKLRHDWSWVQDVHSIRGITDQHRLSAAGLTDTQPCTYAFPTHDNDIVPVKDKRCNFGYCQTNPRCYNHLGVKELLDVDGKNKYIEGRVSKAFEKRKEGVPAGLRNLGATCYANAFLQLWFHNIPFRNAIYACDPIEGSPLFHLAHIFTSLELTQKPFVDPRGLIESLRLNKGEQQDAAEFSKLFLDMIANELLKQKDPKRRNILRDLFQGTIQYTTTCECGFASQRDSSFLELELSLKEGTNLEDRLRHSMADEKLHGDNQYHCQSCHAKRDAIRSAKISNFPPILHFSLLRFVFDPKTYERRKSRASIKFPKTLVLDDHSYHLQAIITHSGPSAHEGHFVCETKEQASGSWFMCNDEEVTPIKRSNTTSENGHQSNSTWSREPPPKRVKPNDDLSQSKDAYMLVYTRLGPVSPSPPPLAIMKKVDRELATWYDEQGQQEVKRYTLEEDYDTLVGAKRQVAKILPGMDCLAPTAQLERWFKAQTIGALFEEWTVPVCPHGDVDPDATAQYKLISLEAFELFQTYGRSLTLTDKLAPTNDDSGGTEGTLQHDDRGMDLANGHGNLPRNDAEIGSKPGSPHASTLPQNLSKSTSLNIRPDAKLDGQLITECRMPFDGSKYGHPSDAAHLASKSCTPGNAVPPAKNTGSVSQSGSSGAEMSRSTTVAGLQTFDNLPRMTICPVCVEAEYHSRTAPGLSKENKEFWKAESKHDRQISRTMDPQFVAYGVTYYYLPDSFVDPWLDFIGNENAERPTLPLKLGRCEHELIPVDLEMDPVHRIDRKGWEQIVQKYGDAEPVTFEFPNVVPPDNLKRSAKTNISVGTCEPCRRQRLSDFVEAEIFIKLERTTIPTSRRAKNKEYPCDVRKDTKVLDIKVDIMQRTNITPINLTLYHDGRELQNQDTMETIGVLAGDQIVGKEVELIEIEDNEPVVERGFGGTALHGRLESCPECTFENQAAAKCCEMCGRPFGFD